MPRISKNNRLKLRRGATAVEFAIVAPIFFLLMLASFEFSRMNVIRHTADNAAYEAARHAMVPGATAAEAVAKANTILNTVGTRGARVTITPTTLGPTVDTINVQIDVPLNQNGWIVPKFTSGRTLTAQSTLRTERAE
ncbi:MAG: TadE/TadG family type IV pilus assembly protein [Bythopirellula sp.]|nr:TadE/TadG family type IV pilus assembly protein [Bythopirellula sp.]